MPDLPELHKASRQILDAALRAVDARAATQSAVTFDGKLLRIANSAFEVSSSPIYVVSFGKAAFSMALGVCDSIGERVAAGVISGPESLRPESFPGSWEVFAGGHPLPNEASLAAAMAVFSLLDRANTEGAVVLFLISGGGSAIIEWPVSEEITLADLREANRLLVACGASISETNAVRRRFSAVKGGKLAGRAGRARIFTLIVSDTNPGDEANVASGPTLPPPLEAPEPLDIIERYKLQSSLPPAVLRVINQKINDAPQIQTTEHYVLLDNLTALKAAALKAGMLGFEVVLAHDLSEQPIQEGCELLVARLDAGPTGDTSGLCLISGGEFSCPVRGAGRGGRNLETALRCAVQLEKSSKTVAWHTVILSAGSDGVDGNSPAAGALADETTISRAHRLNMEADDFLNRSDSYGFFERLDDLIQTGPTGTNVRDVRILIRSGGSNGN